MEEATSKLEHGYTISGWCFCVLKEVREDVKENMSQEPHFALERIVNHLHAPPCPNQSKRIAGMKEGEILDRFWDEFQTFKKKRLPFDMHQDGTVNILCRVSHICGMKSILCH